MRDLGQWYQVNFTVHDGNITRQFRTEDDLGMYLARSKFTLPQPKTEYISIPGRDGDLDFTEALSSSGADVYFGNGMLDMTFKVPDPMNWSGKYTLIGTIHGRRGEVLFTNAADSYTGGFLSDIYFEGRFFVDVLESAKYFGYVNVRMNVSYWYAF